VLHYVWDPLCKIIAELSAHCCCGGGPMATGNDHDSVAEHTSLGCDLPNTSRPEHDPDRAVLRELSS